MHGLTSPARLLDAAPDVRHVGSDPDTHADGKIDRVPASAAARNARPTTRRLPALGGPSMRQRAMPKQTSFGID